MNTIMIFVVLFFNVITVTAFNYNYFCSDMPQDLYILTEKNRKIVSVRRGKEFYSPNEKCEFPIETMEGRRIKLTVEMSDLHSPYHLVRSYCDAYDHVKVMDGQGKEVVSWCGRDHPKEIISKGNMMKVIFKSNDNNGLDGKFRGIRIGIQTFENTTCPPGWYYYKDSCYDTTFTKSTWQKSQLECNQRQSNLVSVDHQDSLTFLFTEIMNKSSELFFWTGLNGLVKPDHLRWVDKSAPKKISSFKIPSWNHQKRCGAIHTKQALMYMQDCEHSDIYALCESKKNAVTQLYPAKQTETRYGIEESNGGEILLAVCIPIIVIIILVMVIVVVLNVMGYGCRSSDD